MEIIQNRYGSDRVIEKISSSKLRIMGESLMSRSSQDEDGNYTMYDFEGGPILTVGGKIRYMKSDRLDLRPLILIGSISFKTDNIEFSNF